MNGDTALIKARIETLKAKEDKLLWLKKAKRGTRLVEVRVNINQLKGWLKVFKNNN